MLQSPKLAILQCLDAMDKVQMEEVLTYIKGILTPSGQKMDPKAFKKEAMKEIRQALRKSKKGMQLAAWPVLLKIVKGTYQYPTEYRFPFSIRVNEWLSRC